VDPADTGFENFLHYYIITSRTLTRGSSCIRDAGDGRVVAGSNVHLFEHMAPPQPYGMDNRRDPPYDTSFHGMGFGSDGR
jgi:hypothetical protein